MVEGKRMGGAVTNNRADNVSMPMSSYPLDPDQVMAVKVCSKVAWKEPFATALVPDESN